MSGRAHWELRVSRRTVLRNEREFRVADTGSTTVEVRLPVPPVKPGVVVPASIEISATLPGAGEPSAPASWRLWVFHGHRWAQGGHRDTLISACVGLGRAQVGAQGHANKCLCRLGL